jgi:hypothetical protein
VAKAAIARMYGSSRQTVHTWVPLSRLGKHQDTGLISKGHDDS